MFNCFNDTKFSEINVSKLGQEKKKKINLAIAESAEKSVPLPN